MYQCPITPPAWFDSARSGTAVCGPGDIARYNTVFSASKAVGMGASGTLTFTVNTGTWNRFQPIGMSFLAINLAATQTEYIGGYTCTALTHAGTNYLLGGALNLLSFGVNGQKALSVQHLPELTPGGQNITLTVNNVDSAVDTTLYGILYGFSR